MLVSMKAILDPADAKKIAVDTFNIISLEGIQTVLGAVEGLSQPVILQSAPIHESVIPFRIIGPVMMMTVEKFSMPVRAHLDHGDKLEILQEALEMGLISVMYDDSVLPLEENTTGIEIVVEIAGNRGTSMKTEIGAMRRQEFSSMGEGEEREAVENYHTDPEQARAFTALIGIDVLACSLGTAHGLYLTTPKLNSGRIHRIRESIGTPAVIHGGSGVNDEDFKRCIASGIRKINCYTYLAKTGDVYVKGKYTDAGEYVSFHNVTQQAVQAMKEDVLHTIEVFSHPE